MLQLPGQKTPQHTPQATSAVGPGSAAQGAETPSCLQNSTCLFALRLLPQPLSLLKPALLLFLLQQTAAASTAAEDERRWGNYRPGGNSSSTRSADDPARMPLPKRPA
jgi:hypothetical protein